jgi:hypothetical protein
MELNLGNIFIGLLAAGLGVLGVVYTFPIMNFTGRQQWLEKYTGQGTTYFVYKIVFLALALFGILYATGFGDDFLMWLLSPLKSVFQPYK